MIPFVCTIIKLGLIIKNVNHEAIHTTKQSFLINYHATILGLLTHFDFASIKPDMTSVYF